MEKSDLGLVVTDDNVARKKREDRDRLFKRYEVIGKALGSARRLEIIDLLIGGERTVEDVATASAMSVANASQHLRHLHNAGLLKVRREGSYAFYGLSLESDVASLWNCLRSLAHTVDPGLRFEKIELPGISCRQLQLKLDDPKMVVLDVRPIRDYNGGRIRSALSVPLETLEGRISELDLDREYIAYDGGDNSNLAGRAQSMLSQAGYRARQLSGGFDRWKAERLPTSRNIASN